MSPTNKPPPKISRTAEVFRIRREIFSRTQRSPHAFNFDYLTLLNSKLSHRPQTVAHRLVLMGPHPDTITCSVNRFTCGSSQVFLGRPSIHDLELLVPSQLTAGWSLSQSHSGEGVVSRDTAHAHIHPHFLFTRPTFTRDQ